MIKKMLYVLFADIVLLLRKLLGCRVIFHPLNLISPEATIRSKGQSQITIGRKVTVRKNSEISATNGHITIGDNCFINRNCMIVSHDTIEIGNNTTIGPGVYIYDHDHDGYGGYSTASVVLKQGVWIGANVVILKGVTIGENAVVAAGSIVYKDVPPDTTLTQKRIFSYEK